MIEFLTENLATIIGAAIVFAVFALIIIKQLINRKKNKGGCGCGCEGCASAGFCHPDKGAADKAGR